jgi:D-tyrosyl-tRNA(Tyr) deacylase
VIQRVSEAQVVVDGRIVGKINSGALVLLGVEQDDSERDSALAADRIMGLRIFADAGGKMNLNLKDAGGQLLVVSQFTLFADLSRGRRPSFVRAAAPEHARRLYEDFIARCRAAGAVVEHGEFGAMMKVSLIGDGPVTIIFDSRSI